jgi:hypothetical protein
MNIEEISALIKILIDAYHRGINRKILIAELHSHFKEKKYSEEAVKIIQKTLIESFDATDKERKEREKKKIKLSSEEWAGFSQILTDLKTPDAVFETDMVSYKNHNGKLEVTNKGLYPKTKEFSLETLEKLNQKIQDKLLTKPQSQFNVSEYEDYLHEIGIYTSRQVRSYIKYYQKSDKEIEEMKKEEETDARNKFLNRKEGKSKPRKSPKHAIDQELANQKNCLVCSHSLYVSKNYRCVKLPVDIENAKIVDKSTAICSDFDNLFSHESSDIEFEEEENEEEKE